MSKNKTQLPLVVFFSIDSDVLINHYDHTDEGYNQVEEVQINTSSISK